MKKLYLSAQFFFFLFNQLISINLSAQTCGTVYGNSASFAPYGPVGVRAYSSGTNTWSASSLVNTNNIFPAPNTNNNGGPIAIDPLYNNFCVVTDNPTKTLAVFNFASASPTLVSFPATLSSVTGAVLCSGFKPASHLCYFMTALFLNSNPSAGGEAFFSIDLTTPGAPVGKIYTTTLSTGSPLTVTTAGGDLCFDLNGIGYLVTSSKQLYRIVTDEAASTATFTFISNLSALTFQPIAIAFDPTNTKLILGGGTQTVAEYSLANNTTTILTTTSGWPASDYASCFFPNINPVLAIKKQVYDSTQHTGTPIIIGSSDVMEYIIVVKNTGNINAGAFTLADALPAGVTYVANSTKMNGSVIPDSATTVKFPFANAKMTNSGNQTVNNGILTTNATTGSGNAGNDSCVITYLVKVAGTNGQVINNTATASVAGLSPTIPLTQSASIAFKIGAGILPVTLIDFYAKQQNGMVELNWATSNEINNSHFEIERSADGANFSTIGNMQSVNINSLTVQQYSFTDNHLPESANTIYYRLKMVDADGQFTYSNTLLVKATGLKENIFVYPTPAADFINIVFVSVVKSDYNVELINAIGRIVYIGEYKNVQSGQVLELERNGLPPGVYILKVVQHSNESFITRRIIFK